MIVTVTTYGCAEYLCRIGLIPGKLEYRSRNIAIADIQHETARRFLIPVAEMKSQRRARRIARPRQVAMYLTRELTGRSMPNIGHHFGGRDHTTVLHACRTIERLRAADPEMDAHVVALKRELGAP